MRSRVLVVEDDRVLAQLAGVWLREAGFEVDVAHDGQAGLNTAAAHRPDVILLDLRMPRLDGFEVMRELQQDPQLNDVPVIVISANVQETTRQRILKSGAKMFLPKPYEPGEMLDAVRRLTRAPGCSASDHAGRRTT
jgi:DNA-binding response OmpR family regulator